MDLSSVNEYLTGSIFSNALKVKIAKAEKRIPYRMETIENIIASKDIIHFGCADHLEVIENKIARNIWFHNRLLARANKCVGIDINPQAIDYLHNKLKIRDLFCLDIESDEVPDSFNNQHFDYLIMGEILEHVDNPVRFLETVHRKFRNLVDQIIITGPNAFRWNNFRNAIRYTEMINSDHRYWFTPYTMAKILSQAGFRDIKFQLVEHLKPDGLSPKKYFIFRLFPAFRDTILMQARFK